MYRSTTMHGMAFDLVVLCVLSIEVYYKSHGDRHGDDKLICKERVGWST